MKRARVISVTAFLIAGSPLLFILGTRMVSGHRIRQHFELGTFQAVKASTIHSAIASRVPPGSSVEHVHTYLQQAGIGSSENSGYGDSLISEKPQIYAWINHGSIIFCDLKFSITFQFEDAPLGRNSDNHVIVLEHVDRLKDIKVAETSICW